MKTLNVMLLSAVMLAGTHSTAFAAQKKTVKESKQTIEQRAAGLNSITEDAARAQYISSPTTCLRVDVPESVARASPSSISYHKFVRQDLSLSWVIAMSSRLRHAQCRN